MNKYMGIKYNHKERWMSYLEQINLVIKYNPKKILIIGVGNNLVPDYLSNLFNVTTLDLDANLNPDILGNVYDLKNLVKEHFDIIICCQVLEHLPFSKFEKIIKMFEEKTKKVIISLPDSRLNMRVDLRLKKLSFKFKMIFPFIYFSNKVHNWEIGWKNSSSKKVRKILKKYFNIIEEYGLFDDPYYRFYVLEVKSERKKTKSDC